MVNMTRKYDSLVGILIVTGILVWVTNPSGDLLETILWRDALWGIAAVVGGYRFGLRQGRLETA